MPSSLSSSHPRESLETPVSASLPAPQPMAANAVGIGLKFQHMQALVHLAHSAQSAHVPQAPDFLELHAENYMNAGGPLQDRLDELARCYPLSVHGVGLSLGSAEGIDPAHLERLARLVDHLNPALVSEHLAWSRLDGHSYNDLLPVPLTEESLRVLGDNIARTQDRLGRRLLVENPSLYVSLDNRFSETEFLQRLVDTTGCGLLFDVNNAYISAANLGRDLDAYLDEVPWAAVGEWHLAGHSLDAAGELYIDDHGSAVSEPVWQRYRQVLARRPGLPTLIEWDNRVPTLERWMQEVDLARQHQHAAHGPGADASTALAASASARDTGRAP
ncbi:DUF692 domain-containing protein [Halomonas sp. DP1Y21-3]|uniref:MNIO family bufferin maturase n=1 Tax=Halomonas sp. DP1Y21-3 TaxID=2859080 RepID=UPI0021BD1C19|nr:DUF692 domain-containing protein [Halomonas sp. DP1Y21-3]